MLELQVGAVAVIVDGEAYVMECVTVVVTVQGQGPQEEVHLDWRRLGHDHATQDVRVLSLVDGEVCVTEAVPVIVTVRGQGAQKEGDHD